jgi:hypothetical protein
MKKKSRKSKNGVSKVKKLIKKPLCSYRIGERVIITGTAHFEIAEIVSISDHILLSNMIKTTLELVPINSNYRVLPYDETLANQLDSENKTFPLIETLSTLYRNKKIKSTQFPKIVKKLTYLINYINE